MKYKASSLNKLLPTPIRQLLRIYRATVTQVNPLRVKLDVDEEANPVTPTTLATALQVDDRVICLMYRRSLLVLGRIGGMVVRQVALTISAGTPQYSPQVYRDPLGWVSVDGGVTRAASVLLGTAEIPTGSYVVVGNLPVGYRPAKYQYYPTILPNNAYPAGLRVQTSGAIEVIFGTGASTAVVLPLTGIRFKGA